MAVRALGLVVLLAAAPAAAERFYPVMGPDGRIQMIRSPEAAAETSPPATEPGAADTATAADSAVSQRPAAVVLPAPSGAGEAAPAPAESVNAGAAPLFAPYDSDEYADSEAVEQALDREAAGKKRFYVINDGLGANLTESDPAAGQGGLAPVLPESLPSLDVEPSYPVPALLQELPAAQARERFPALPACLERPRLDTARLIAGGLPASLVLHRATYTFLDESRLVELYRIAGEGPRTLVLRSYSRTDRNPIFAQPHVGFLDGNGCLTRVVVGYYDELYPRTDSRHAMLRAELMVHSDEAYALVLASRGASEIATALPYGYSPYGQLKLILKK